jgi:hypothetical protein
MTSPRDLAHTLALSRPNSPLEPTRVSSSDQLPPGVSPGEIDWAHPQSLDRLEGQGRRRVITGSTEVAMESLRHKRLDTHVAEWEGSNSGPAGRSCVSI